MGIVSTIFSMSRRPPRSRRAALTSRRSWRVSREERDDGDRVREDARAGDARLVRRAGPPDHAGGAQSGAAPVLFLARRGTETYVGPIVAVSLLRELGPVLTAILVGGKVASGITAELGSMKVTEQIDALRALGVNYIKRLIVPRLLAALLVFPVVTVLADGIGLVGGMLISVFDRNVDAYLYWNTISYWVVLKDFLTGVGKSVVFGAIVTLIGCYNGLATEGGTEGLGRSTTATVVQVAMGVIISDFFLTKLLLFLFW